MISYNNKLILTPYTGKTGIRSTGEKTGFASVQQKTNLIGLKLLADAKLELTSGLEHLSIDGVSQTIDKNLLKKGQIVYFREEDLHASSWSTTVFSSDALKGGFVLGPATQMVMVK